MRPIVMASRKLAPLVALSLVLGIWPAACAGRAMTEGPEAGAGPGVASAEAPLPNVPRAFLPSPALAHAQSSGKTVSIADVAEKAAPSVVNVSSSRTRKVSAERQPFFEDPFFRHFFGPGQEEPEQRGRKQEGMGSGVIVSADGVVLTNSHVVEGADEIRVTLPDKREFPAKVVGTDAKSDVAVLRLQGDVKGLSPIELGDSSRLRLGDVVLAIGNPFGVGQTITMGIVSAKGRANVGIAAYEDFIQTDAAINPGNSGGALVDMEGRLVGINTAILSRSGGSMGIGFAIPTNMVQPIMKALVDHGKVVRGWLGIGIQDVDQELASALGLLSAQGVLVSDVKAGGPGAKAGLQSGDVILKINGVVMSSTGELRNTVAASGASSTVRVEVLREGKSVALEAVLGELPDQAQGAGPASRGGGPASGALDGLTLEDLTPELRQKLGVPPETKKGVVVSGVERASAAEAAGLRSGDLVLEVNRVPVADVASFKQAYMRAKGRVLLRVARGDRTLFVVVKR